MSSREYTVRVVLVVVMMFAAGNAYPNGINPPRPSGSNAVKTMCKESPSGDGHEIFRTLVMAGSTPLESLSFVIGDVKESINITDIRTITIGIRAVGSDEFAGGALVRTDGTEEKAVRVQVRIKGTPIYLTGFTENGVRLSIDIAKCRSVEFSSAVTPNENHRPVMKN
jgi:hypothetical protein